MESPKKKSVAMIDSNSESDSDMSDSEFQNLAKKPKLDTEQVSHGSMKTLSTFFVSLQNHAQGLPNDHHQAVVHPVQEMNGMVKVKVLEKSKNILYQNCQLKLII